MKIFVLFLITILFLHTELSGQEYFSFYNAAWSWPNTTTSKTDHRSDPDPQEFTAYTGCLYADVSIVLSGGGFYDATYPKYSNLGATYGFGMDLGVNWTTCGQTLTYTITFKNAAGGPATEFPVSFSLFGVNSHLCGTISANRFIDQVTIVGYKSDLTTVVNPTITKNCANATLSGNTLTGTESCGSFNSNNTADVSFSSVARIVITYSSGTGDPPNLNCGGSPAPLAAGDDPRAQNIYVSAFKVTSASTTPPSAVVGSASICSGNSATLTATGGLASSQWYSGSCGGPLVGTGTSINVTPGSTTTYYVANQNLCTYTACANGTVTVNATPVADAGSNTSICASSSTTLNGSGGGTYSWSPAGTLSDPSISNPIASPSATTTYTVTVTSPGGCTATDNVTITVSPSSYGTLASGDETACDPQNIDFIALPSSTGATGYTYEWFYSDGLVSCPVGSSTSGWTSISTNSVSSSSLKIVEWNFPGSPDNAVADAGVAANLAKTITTGGGTATLAFNLTGSLTRAASANTWGTGANTKYWEVEFTTSGYYDLKVSSKQYSDNAALGNKGPRDFKLQYKIGAAGAYTDICNVPAINNNWTSGVLNSVSLPQACSNQPSVYLRWIMTSNIGTSGGAITNPGGVTRIDDIIITGTQAIPYDPPGPQNVDRTYACLITINGGICNGSSFWSSPCRQVVTSCGLPVDFLQFKTYCTKEGALLYWSTLSELNNDYYTVEKSSDGYLYKYLSMIKGNGTINHRSDNSFIDNDPIDGISYYRLKQTDFNGHEEVLETDRYDNNCSDLTFKIDIFPNPVKDFTTFNIYTEKDSELLINIEDISGREIESIYNGSINEGYSVLNIDLSTLKPGVYFITANSGINYNRYRILKQ